MRTFGLMLVTLLATSAFSATPVTGKVKDTTPLVLTALNPGKPGNMLAFEDGQGCRYVVPDAFTPGKDVSINMRMCKGQKKLEDFLARAKNVPSFEVGQTVTFERL